MIKNDIESFQNNLKARFFFPGHKGILSKLDVTELDQTDDLYHAHACLAFAQQETAQIFGAYKSFYLVNGSTVGIMATIAACCKAGDKLAVNRSCHRSVINAAKLVGIETVFIEEPNVLNFNIPGSIALDYFERFVKEHSNIVGAVLTSPSYYGICSDIKSIAEMLHKIGKFLFVDSAHGAHVLFDNRLPVTPIKCGADACVMSAHKTLSAFTQSSVLHINYNSLINAEKVFEQIKIFQTSSPSFLLLSRLEQALNEEAPNVDKSIIACVQSWYERCLKCDFKYKILTKMQVFDKDIMRIVINFSECGCSAKYAAHVLFDKYRIAIEMYDDFNVVCVVTFWNKPRELKQLFLALEGEWG